MIRRSRAARKEEKRGWGWSQDLLQELEVGFFVKCIVGHVLEEPPREREVREADGWRMRPSEPGHPMTMRWPRSPLPLPGVGSLRN